MKNHHLLRQGIRAQAFRDEEQRLSMAARRRNMARSVRGLSAFAGWMLAMAVGLALWMARH